MKKSGKRFLQTFDNLMEGCQVIGFDWQYLYLNDAAAIQSRCPKIELLGEKYTDAWPGSEQTELFRIMKDCMDNRVYCNFMNKFIFPDGSEGWFELRIQPVPEGIFILSMDITGRTKAEDELRESLEKYRIISENADDWIYWMGPDGHLLYISPSCERMTGYSQAEFINSPKLMTEIAIQDDRANMERHSACISDDRNSDTLEYRIITKSGEVCWIGHSCIPLYNGEGKYIGRRGTNRNITSLVQAKQLAESQHALISGLINSTRDMVIFSLDTQYCYTAFNEEHRALMKRDWNRDIEIGMNMPECIIRPELRALTKISIDRALKGDSFTEIQHQADSSIYYEYSWNTVFIHEKVSGVAVLARNITDRMMAEEALKISEEKFRNVFEQSVVGKSMTSPGGKMKINKSFSDILGYSETELSGLTWQSITHPGDVERDTKIVAAIIAGEHLSYRWEKRYVHKNGNVVWVDISTTLHRDKNSIPLYFITSITDISERKRMEAALLESEHHLRRIRESGIVGMIYWSMDGQISGANDKFLEMTGYTREDLELGNIDWIRMTPAEFVYLDEISRLELKATGVNRLPIEKEYIRKDGNRITILYSATMLDEERHKGLAIMLDITERKQAEESLRLKNLVFDNSIAANSIADCDGFITEANDAFLRMWGYNDRNEVIGKPVAHFINDSSGAIAIITGLNNQDIWEGDYTARKQDGSTFEAHGLATTLRDANDKLLGYQSSVTDNSGRMMAEQDLRAMSARQEAILAAVPDIITEVNLKKVYTWANQAGIEFFGDDLIGKEAAFYFAGEQETNAKVEPLLRGDDTLAYIESWQRRKDGEHRLLAWWSRGMVDNHGNISGILSTARDITEFRQATELLRNSEERYRSLITNLEAGVVVHAPDTSIVMNNYRASVLLGLSDEQMRGKQAVDPDWKFLDTEGKPLPLDKYPVNRILAERKSFENLTLGVLQPFTGKTVWLIANGLPVFNIGGEIAEVLISFIDITERIESEKRLMASETKFRQLVGAMQVGIVVQGPGTEIMLCNPRALELLGLSEEQLLGKTSLDPDWNVIHEDGSHFPGTEHPVTRAIASRSPVRNVVMGVYRPSPGDRVWLFVDAEPQLDTEGKVYQVVCSFIDITGLKKAEEALRASEKKFRDTIVNLDEGYYSVTLEGVLLDHNQAFNRMLGFESNADLKGIFLPDFWQNPGERQAYLKECMATGLVTNYQISIISSKGDKSTVLASAHIIRDQDNRPVRIEGIFQDITERIRSEEALRIYSERLRNLHNLDRAILKGIDSHEEIVGAALQHINVLLSCQRASIGIFDANKKQVHVFTADISIGTILQVNIELTQAVISDPEFLHQYRTEIIEDISAVASPSELLRILQTEGIRSCINIPLLLGDTLIGAMNLGWNDPRSFTGEEKEIAGEIAGQITIAIEQVRLRLEAKRYASELEQRVEERTARLLAANKELEAFSYSVSHDLRSPLRGIHGFTEILMEDYADKFDAEGKRICTIIRDNAMKMGHLIDDLLAFSRLGRTDIQQSDLEIKNMVSAVYFEITNPELRKRINLSVDELQNVRGDPTMIKQVWINLLSNAIKFSSKKETAVISISAVKEKGQCVYCVRDNGAGFNMKYIDKLFGVFQRLHNERDFEGIGVGLAIVQRIVHRHGGDVWAEGEVDKGAAFFFSLPINDSEFKGK